ncbi:xanthine dehydrogenase family protein subunit M [Candidatus Chlorohelix sp.]|uniref:xanthine dehydrogenase family protein subunit M n=1 Tax=Candidatus Chlorohelix sp. TaxID=3139201 RepID=UPI00306D40AC
MIPSTFDYFAPAALDEALSLLSEHGDNAKILAGGHSLIPAMRLRLAQPGVLIDIKGLRSQLSYIKEEGGRIKLGAMTNYYSLETSDLLKQKAPILPEAASTIGDVQVRNWGTIGGSTVHADPSSDLPAVLLALDASVTLKSSKSERVVALSDFFVSILTTSIEPSEILTEISFPTPAGKKTSYKKLANKASHFSVVGAAAIIGVDGNGVCTSAAIGFSGLAAVPMRSAVVENALVGKKLDAATIEAACSGSAADVDALSDLHGSQEYRRAMADVFAKRAIKAALAS